MVTGPDVVAAESPRRRGGWREGTPRPWSLDKDKDIDDEDDEGEGDG